MSVTTERKLAVRFMDGLPAGRRAIFTVDKEMWIALPLEKHKRLTGCIDRLIGLQSMLADEMVRWVNRRPQDAEFCVCVMERVTKLRQAHRELVVEKIEASVS